MSEKKDKTISEALQKYKEIQLNNIKAFEEIDPDYHAQIMSQIEDLANLDDNIPAHKSALLQRLMQNKLPLKYPPPLSFSQPWYDLIDECKPIPILLGGYRPKEEIDGTFFEEGLIINQTLWKISSFGNQAKKLMNFLNKYMNQDSNEIYGLLLFDDWGILNKIENEDLINIYVNQPYFIVENQFWGKFKVQCVCISELGLEKLKNKNNFDYFISQSEFTINVINQQHYIWIIQKE